MRNQSISASFTDKESKFKSNYWARIEQDYKPKASDAASVGDLLQMMSLAAQGDSSYEYVKDACPYASVESASEEEADGEVVTVDLIIYVWPSSMDLNFDISVEIGEIIEPLTVSKDRSFDVVFKDTTEAVMEYVFDGTFTSEMSFIRKLGGEHNPDPSHTIEGSLITLSKPSTVVLRADGVVSGYQYTVRTQLTKESGFKISNLKNTVTVSWLDEEGKTQTDEHQLDIPPCVEDLLKDCSGSPVIGLPCIGSKCINYYTYDVYWNVCDNEEVLKEGWVEHESKN